MFTSSILTTLSLVAASTLAAPTARSSGCDLSGVSVDIPAGQTVLTSTSAPVSFVGIGVGTQNYTCSSSGTFTSAGAVAQLFDLSCIINTPAFTTIDDSTFAAWSAADPSLAPERISSPELAQQSQNPSAPPQPILGQHYFVPNPATGTGLSPKWDFSSGVLAGNANAFVVAAKAGNIPAPTGSSDVDWLMLNSVQGQLATRVYRTDTRGGQPPSSCTPGSPPITVKYTSKYWLAGATVQA